MKIINFFIISSTTITITFVIFFGLSLSFGYFANVHAQCLFDLTGKWTGDDGGTYYIGQKGFPGTGAVPKIWWFGSNALGENAFFSNVFQGEMRGGDPSGKYIIVGKWADVPMGKATGSGDMTLIVETYTKYSDNQFGGSGKNPVTFDVLTITSKTGGFGGTQLTRPQPTCGG